MLSKTVNSTPENDINPSKRQKLSLNNDSVLQIFVESPFEKREIRDLGTWLKSQDIDINNPAWYSLFLWNREVEDENANSEDSFKVRVTFELKNILPFLLNCNDDVSYIDKNGQTILHVYLANSESEYRNSQSNNKTQVLEIVKSLIEKGASVNAIDKQGKTPLHVAAETRKFEILKLMLESFDNVDACDTVGNTILHAVVERIPDDVDTILEIVRILLGKGADPNRKNEANMTPLHLAVCNYNVDMLQIFRENGADFSVLTDNHENLLLLAYKHCNFRIPESKMLKIVNFLVDRGCDVNVQNKDGYSPVHYAVKWKTTLKRLIELDADVNYQTKIKRKTPLHLAVDMERWDCDTVRTLYRAGADWDALDFEGRTPLDLALEGEGTEMAERILVFGGQLNKHKLGKCYRYLHLVNRHEFMMTAIGFAVGGVNKYKGNLDKKRFCENCLEEVKKLKAYVMSDGVSIYDFLHMDFKCQFVYVDCLPQDLDGKFPFYANFITRMRNEIVRRNKLLRPAKKAWNQVVKINFPDVCVERIFRFLSNWNLKVLIDVAEASDDMKALEESVARQEGNTYVQWSGIKVGYSLVTYPEFERQVPRLQGTHIRGIKSVTIGTSSGIGIIHHRKKR